MSFVIKAIKTMAIALHQLQQDTCGVNVTGACAKMYPFNGTLFFVSLDISSFLQGVYKFLHHKSNCPTSKTVTSNFYLILKGQTWKILIFKKFHFPSFWKMKHMVFFWHNSLNFNLRKMNLYFLEMSETVLISYRIQFFTFY